MRDSQRPDATRTRSSRGRLLHQPSPLSVRRKSHSIGPDEEEVVNKPLQ